MKGIKYKKGISDSWSKLKGIKYEKGISDSWSKLKGIKYKKGIGDCQLKGIVQEGYKHYIVGLYACPVSNNNNNGIHTAAFPHSGSSSAGI